MTDFKQYYKITYGGLQSSSKRVSAQSAYCKSRLGVPCPDFGGYIRFCCRKNFQSTENYILEPKGYAERILACGFCPHCGVWIVELSHKDFSGNWISIRGKGKKALRLYDANIPDFIRNLEKELRKGNRTNMGFRYGENVEIKNRKGDKSVKQYAVDFNGTKELIKTF